VLLGAWATDRSEEALVGDRAAKVSNVRYSSTTAEVSVGLEALTEVPSRNTKDTAHNGEEDLQLYISFSSIRC